MELILVIFAIIFIFIFIKYLLKKFLLLLLFFLVSAFIAFVYKIPYSISISSILIFIYSIKCIVSEFKYFGGNLVKPCKFYLNGAYEKLVSLLFSLNYIVFMFICYVLLMSKSFYIIEFFDLIILFCLTWLCIWFVGNSRNTFLRYINPKKCKI